MISPLPFTFCPQLLVRTPALPFSDFSPGKLESILRDHDFQQAILLASSALYAELRKRNFDHQRLDSRLRLAAFKYYNRMSYRPTPFGAFASVALLPWGNAQHPAVRSRGYRLLSMPDFRELMKRPAGFSAQTLFYRNPTVFALGDKYRYLCRSSQKGERDSFLVVELDKTHACKRLLEVVKSPVAYPALLEFLGDELGYTSPQDELARLVSTQVLYHTELPAITRRQFPFLSAPPASQEPSYTIAYHSQQGCLQKSFQQDILDGLFALDRLCGSGQPESLSRFVAQFSERFGEAEVPLLMAMDPQAGVSYLGNETTGFQQDGPCGLPSAADRRAQEERRNAARALMLSKLGSLASGREHHIVFSEAEISALPARATGGLSYPPSIPVVFRLADRSVFIESAGGCSAVGLAGRFSHDRQIMETLKQLTALEQQRNPEVVFAELAAADNHATDNISTRAQLRDYEIPLLVGSELPAGQLIPLKDLTLRVSGGQLILRSRRLNKQVIPRLSSAYNYRLSNLPVFHLLADLQYQGLNCDFSFDVQSLVPGLAHYPRIVYQNCILSAARWIWDEQVLKSFGDPAQALPSLLDHARQQKLTRFFTLSSGDRELVFDLDSPSSLEYFLAAVKGSRKAVLKEYFFAECTQRLRDADGAEYTAQMVAFLVSTAPAYRGPAQPGPPFLKRKNKAYLPGSDWLYFKIYGHRETLNELLRDPALKRILNGFSGLGGIRCWFFVRYADPGPHLRIRLRVHESFSPVILRQVSALLKTYTDKHLLSGFNLGCYEPEIQRYGRAGMRRVEKIFQRSSEAALAFHLLVPDQLQESIFAVSCVTGMLAAFLPQISERAEFTGSVLKAGLLPASLRVRLDRFYRHHRDHLEQALADPLAYYPRPVSDKLRRLLDQCCRLQQRLHRKGRPADLLLIADLVHMHLNRLNASGSADLEISTYYLLSKHYRAVLARKTVLL